MYLATRIVTKVFLWFFLLSLSQEQVFSYGREVEEPPCTKKCGGMKTRKEAQKKGELLCAHEEGRSFRWGTSCELECLRRKPNEDQVHCWKEYCVLTPLGFCEMPGKRRINADDCEKLLYAGKVKFYGDYCWN